MDYSNAKRLAEIMRARGLITVNPSAIAIDPSHVRKEPDADRKKRKDTGSKRPGKGGRTPDPNSLQSRVLKELSVRGPLDTFAVAISLSQPRRRTAEALGKLKRMGAVKKVKEHHNYRGCATWAVVDTNSGLGGYCNSVYGANREPSRNG